MNKLRAPLYVMLLCVAMISFAQCQANEANSVPAQQQESTEVEEPQKVEEENAVLVEAVTISPRSMNSFILLSSTITTEEMVEVFPQIQGINATLLVEEGDIVKKGDVLLTLDDNVQNLEVERAEVMFRQKENEYKRKKQSYEKEIISKADLDNAEFDMKSAEVAWKQAKLNLTYTKITSPINGVVTERTVRNGDRVQPSNKLFKVVNTSELIAEVFIPEQQIGSVRKGQLAEVTSEFLKKVEIKGRIKRISPVVDPNSGTFKVTVGLSDPQKKLRPGMFISVQIITAEKDNVIAIPKDAIVYDSGLPFVFVVNKGVAKKIPLVVGFSDEQYVESLVGLSVGDTIITVGQSGLKDNTKVKLLPAKS